MRRVIKQGIPKPAILDRQDCMDHLRNIIADRANIKPDENFYKGLVIAATGQRIMTVAISLKDLYLNKCAYCEKLCYDPEVEHYRPKLAVTNPNGNNHGYYWLCYEWTNLLPSCHACNFSPAKHNKFPISGVRKVTYPVTNLPPVLDLTQNLYDSPYLLGEGPQLIHPEYCLNFQQHFSFDITGHMYGISPAGIVTVRDIILDNPTLNGMRREIYEGYLSQMRKKTLRHFSTGTTEENFHADITDIIEKMLLASLDEYATFTLFRKYILDNVEEFFIQQFDEVYQDKLREAISVALLEVSA